MKQLDMFEPQRGALPNVIGLCGQAGAGKDTAAKWFIERGYGRSGFADPIKHMLNDAFNWTMADWEDREWKERTDGSRAAVTAFDSLGMWRDLSPRILAQWLGTEVVRNNFGNDAWVNLWKQRWHDGGQPRVVVADVRFQNEIDAIHKCGGIVLRITRGPYSGKIHMHEGEIEHRPHDSERTGELRNIDHSIANDGSIVDLYETLARTFV